MEKRRSRHRKGGLWRRERHLPILLLALALLALVIVYKQLGRTHQPTREYPEAFQNQS